ncbi:MAG: TauD/TfdA family dioxygenase [Rhodospirillum sp.]|nr:TauD/TfdA family dioxygenase [Rhodospirillum sp.]MCF8488365.1 TauD/TfdA family dioxygenase [Rhodospirillum sp.]MCF8500625.1 TauD/TfdA family dioxygenase [Rhodospirillum sp.]
MDKMIDINGRFQRQNLISSKRRAINFLNDLVSITHYSNDFPLPLVQATEDGINLAVWARQTKKKLEELLSEHGGILFRGFDIGESLFQETVESLSDGLLEYTFGSTPRSRVSGKVYTSTEYPQDQTIPLHNEMSYAAHWPKRLWFFCGKAAENGGATPIADSHRVHGKLPVPLRKAFEERGVMYVRRYGEHLDVRWQDSFQTTDRRIVDAECARQGATREWLDSGHLITRTVRPAVLIPERGGGPVWFNQVNLFHTSALPREMQTALHSVLQESELPRTVYFGDGAPIDADMIACINATYEECAQDVNWCPRDILLLDNERLAHGRRPFKGDRRVLVAMTGQGSSRNPHPDGDHP